MTEQPSVVVTIDQVATMLRLFPLDGLRKAALTYGLKTPSRGDSVETQKETLIVALIEGLGSGTLTKNPIKTDPDAMWTECHARSQNPVRISGDTVPALDAEMKRSIANNILSEIKTLGDVQCIEAMCAGKVSSVTKSAEKSAICKRWRDRYGRSEFGYTGMRRLYVDETTSSDFKARELLALDIEKHAFSVIKQHFGSRASSIIQFSEESGRQATGKTYGPQWKVFVYLAFRLKATVSPLVQDDSVLDGKHDT